MATLDFAQTTTRDSTQISLINVTKSFADGLGGRRVILNDCSHEFAAGQVHLLLGRSGTGKSTLLNLIAAIDQPDSGEIRIGETLISAISEKERTLFRRFNLGFVFQSFHLLPELTVFENALLPLELTAKLSREDAENSSKNSPEQSVTKWLKRLGLEDRAQDFPDRLSGGEQQRVGLIRALIHSPRVLLADEPTGNLDQSNATLVLSLIREICHETGATALVVSHDVGCKAYADKTYELTTNGIREL